MAPFGWGKKKEKAPESFLFRQKLEKMMNPLPLDDSPSSPYFKKGPLTEEELESNKQLLEAAKNSRIFQLLLKSEELTAREAEAEARENQEPCWKEDAPFWKKLPRVPSPWGGPPLVRKSFKDVYEGEKKFVDFFQQFQFGLWGYQQRPYPPEKPADVQQALGFKFLDKTYADFQLKTGGWYYKDRLGRTRGPMEIVNMKTAWTAGIIDKNTFIWGDDMDEWAPVGQVFGLEKVIVTPDVKLATLGTKIVHRIATGLNISKPKKGHEMDTYAKLQEAALQRMEREKNIMRNSGGVWPGERIPSHVLGMWAGGSQLTNWLEDNGKTMPDKFIPYHIRKKLAEKIPGLRPWEILDVEQVWDLVTFHRSFYREPLGTHTAPPDYLDDMEEAVRDEYIYGLQQFRKRLNRRKARLQRQKERLTSY